MTLHILGSSSSGNAYVLENDSEAIIIDCGVNISKIKQAFNFDIRKVKFALCTHPHSDHNKCVPDLLRAGIPVYGNEESFGNLRYYHTAHIIKHGEVVAVGNWKVLAVDAKHDVPCLAFMVQHKDIGNLLYMTDSYYTEYKFKNINNILIECNFSSEILNAKQGYTIEPFRANRLRTSHMSLETLKDFLRANDLSNCHSIGLCHLSNSNSDAALFQRDIEALTGISTFIADAGLTIDNYGESAGF
jgi:phosphoribosyl 1,2-cyclic phosphodiesterase